ncbi:hypothetical protein [Manganibacter manganicus]|nr:hypothetical protein [Pseudaminobacter manganicus]
METRIYDADDYFTRSAYDAGARNKPKEKFAPKQPKKRDEGNGGQK